MTGSVLLLLHLIPCHRIQLKYTKYPVTEYYVVELVDDFLRDILVMFLCFQTF